MGYSFNFKYDCTPHHRGLLHFTLSFLFLLISISTNLCFTSAGRSLRTPLSHSQEEKTILRGQIGSRPPRCERRCSSCGHCEAIQVPTKPQIKAGRKGNSCTNTTTPGGFTIAYSRSDDNSNYKPMSWKCKCGNFIFNP